MPRIRSRRTFLRRTAFLSLAAPSVKAVRGANDRIHLGLIGAGKRGFTLMNRMRTQKKYPCVFTAICDVYPPHLDRARAAAGKTARSYTDWRKLLEQKEVDAVVVATPDHLHHDQFLLALQAQKHLYIETPLSHSIAEAHRMARAAEKSKCVVQVGLQERSGPHFLSAFSEVLKPQALGTITESEAWWRVRWTGPAREDSPEGLNWELFLGGVSLPAPTAAHFWSWRTFWAFSGGVMAEKGQHLCDWIHWFSGSAMPRAVAMTGGTYVMKKWEVPDTFTAVWRYPESVSSFSANVTSSFNVWHDHGVCLRGTEGSLQVSRRGWRFYSEKEKRVMKEQGPSDLDGAHIENFLSALRAADPSKAAAPVSVALSSACAAHAANEAYRKHTTLSIDAAWKLTPLR